MTRLRGAALRKEQETGPQCWVTMFRNPDGGSSLGDVYMTEVGAQAEVDFLRSCGYSGLRLPSIIQVPLNTDALAKARWDV
jgi:hypothetical protein